MSFLQRIIMTVTMILLVIPAYSAKPNDDPLPSWNNQKTKKDILTFVQNVVDPHNSNYVPIEDRVVTFDNDGTLWVEQPLYTSAIFASDQIKRLAPQHPEWQGTESFKTFLTGNNEALTKLTVQDVERIIAVTHAGMTVEEFRTTVKHWLETTNHLQFQYPYIKLIYQPMLELVHYLQNNNFKIYIVTGGGQEFVRVYGELGYGIPREQTIGSIGETKYIYKNGIPTLIKRPQVLLVDEFAGKPEGIEIFIGRKPLMAFGNSDGDRQMLEWTQSRPGPHFMALVHHDDAKREFAYGPESKVGTFSDGLMAEAKQQDWDIISMQNDWKIIFPLDKTEKSNRDSVQK